MQTPAAVKHARFECAKHMPKIVDAKGAASALWLSTALVANAAVAESYKLW